MDTSKLLELVLIQSQIIELLIKKYNDIYPNPSDKNKVIELQKALRDLQKQLE